MFKLRACDWALDCPPVREHVLQAVENGHDDAGLIACILGLKRERVQTELSRLAAKGWVFREVSGVHGGHWRPRRMRCWLQFYWT